MPTDRETEIENALSPIQDKLKFLASSLELHMETGLGRRGIYLGVAVQLLRELDEQIREDVIDPMYKERDHRVGREAVEEVES